MKKQINEGVVSGFIGKFLTDLQSGTQDRFIAQAKKKKMPKTVVNKLTVIENEIDELKKILKDL